MQWSVPRKLLWAIIAALVVVVLGLSHALLRHPPYGTQLIERNQEFGPKNAVKQNDEQSDGTEFWPTVFGIKLKITDSLLAVFTFGLLSFTALLWRSTDKLWTAGERQLTLLSDTSKRQLRAYVTVNGVIRTKNPGDLNGNGFAVLIDVKNNGQTPASHLLQWAKIEIRDFPLTGQLPIHCLENPTRGILPPDTKTMAFPTFTRALTVIEENAVLANHTAVYVYGEIEYLDVFW